ncbi:MAG: right-handed parallel beta-helix repeat-containing protein [Candidatus Bathyarchaeota archaeon]|nr:right-handed parallel beta-helix repeat-containing protein [Candidatus Bathyarchaeota archaeon]
MPTPVPTPSYIIKADGTVEPETSLIQKDGNVYTLTGDISGYTIAVEANGIIVDGGGYKLIGNGNLAGVFVQQHTVTIRNMKISNYKYGILFTWLYGLGKQDNHNIVSDNVLTNNTIGLAIKDYSDGSVISRNVMENNDYGIVLGDSSNSVLRNNQMTNNRYNFFVSTTTVASACNDVDTSNTVDGKPIVYWVNQHNKVVPSDAGYIGLVNCSNITVKDFELVNNGQAIFLAGVKDSTITQNSISNNQNGLWLAESSNNTISENSFTDNTYDTIFVVSSTDNKIVSNTITNNGQQGTPIAQVLGSIGRGAVRISRGSNNNVSKNTITNNGEGINIDNSIGTIVDSNTITNNNGSAVHLFDSSQVNITRNLMQENNGCGVKIWNSNTNYVHYNIIEKNSNGISVDGSPDNKITYNTSNENLEWGIQIESDTPNDVLASRNNVIHHNNFVGNKASGLEVSIPGIWWTHGWIDGLGNVWDDGSEGNYWGDYQTRYPNAKNSSLTTWNTEYEINANNTDHFPLTAPVEVDHIPEFGSLVALAVAVALVAFVLAFYKQKLSV